MVIASFLLLQSKTSHHMKTTRFQKALGLSSVLAMLRCHSPALGLLNYVVFMDSNYYVCTRPCWPNFMYNIHVMYYMSYNVDTCSGVHKGQ